MVSVASGFEQQGIVGIVVDGETAAGAHRRFVCVFKMIILRVRFLKVFLFVA